MDRRDRGNSQGRRTGVTVTGHGSAAAAVDRVTVTLGVILVRPDAGAAFQAAAHTATRVMAILADDGADSRSVRTSDLTLGPQIEWRDNRELLVGYQAGQRLIVQLPGLAGLERMLTDVAVGGGEGVRIDSVTLTPSNPEVALREARAIAFGDALAKASHLAGLAGRLLGDLSWIEERQGDEPQPHVMGLARSPMAANMPVATGDTVVGASLTARWLFADPA